MSESTGDSAAAGDGQDSDPVEHYLDELADRLPVRGRALRRILAEAQDHLDATRAAHVRAGMDEDRAGRRAVADYGDVHVVVRSMTRGGGPLTAALVRQTVLALLLVAGIGLVAIGVSGAVAWGAGRTVGQAFVAGDAPGVVYTADRCTEYHQLAPQEQTCAAAAVAHHFDEVVGYRLDAGVLGVLALAVWWVIARWRRHGRDGRAPSYDVLPAGFVATIGAALFGLAALMLPAGMVELVATGADHGAGALLSAGSVAAVAFVGFAAALVRTVRPRTS